MQARALRRGWGVGISAVFMAWTLASAEQPWLLRFDVPTGETYRFAMTQVSQTNMELGPLGKQTSDSTNRFEMRQVVTGRDLDGTIVTDLVFDRLVQETKQNGITKRFDTAAIAAETGPEEPLQRFMREMIGNVLTLKISPRAEVQGVSGMDSLWSELANALPDNPAVSQLIQMIKQSFSDEAMKVMMQQSLAVFPEAPVSIGDTWTLHFDMPNPILGTLRSILTYRVEGEEPRRAHKCLKLAVTTTTSLEGQSPFLRQLSALLRQQGQDVDMAWAQSDFPGQGMLWVTLEHGLTVESDFTQHMGMNVTLRHPQQGERQADTMRFTIMQRNQMVLLDARE